MSNKMITKKFEMRFSDSNSSPTNVSAVIAECLGHGEKRQVRISYDLGDGVQKIGYQFFVGLSVNDFNFVCLFLEQLAEYSKSQEISVGFAFATFAEFAKIFACTGDQHQRKGLA